MNIYIIVTHADLDVFQHNVNVRLTEGYQPLGGLTAALSPDPQTGALSTRFGSGNGEIA